MSDTSKPAAYLAIKDAPPVLLCEATRAGRRAGMIIAMGRYGGAVSRYRFTRMGIADIAAILDDPRHAAMPAEAPEAAPHGVLVAAFRALVDGASLTETTPGKPEFDEFSLPGRLFNAMTTAMTAPDCIDYVPPNRKFIETRDALYRAAGKAPPGAAAPASEPSP